MATENALLTLFNDISNYSMTSRKKLYLEMTKGLETDKRFDGNKANYSNWEKLIHARLVDYPLLKVCDIFTGRTIAPAGTFLIQAFNYFGNQDASQQFNSWRTI